MKQKKPGNVILIVEDDPFIGDLIRYILQDKGYRVPVTVTSGEAVLEKVSQLQPDLILMDIELTGEMDGIEAAKEIWKNFDIPVIFVSSYSTYEYFQRAKGPGIYGYLKKPIDEISLIFSIETALYRSNLEKKLKESENRYHFLFTEEKKAQKQLQKYQQHLEELVEERTALLKRTNEKLKNEIIERETAQGEIKRLNLEIMNSQENERQRVAKDLHDSVGQTMLAAKINLEAFMMQPQKHAKRLNMAIEFIDKASEELKEVYTGLYPSMLSEIGLKETIHWYAKNYLRINNIKAKILYNIPGEISDELKVNIYRIIQELFSNIVKHSKADNVTVKIAERKNRRIVLSINDNGRGFDLKKLKNKKKGFGLSNIDQRVKNFGGTMKLESNSKQGTRISLSMSMPNSSVTSNFR